MNGSLLVKCSCCGTVGVAEGYARAVDRFEAHRRTVRGCYGWPVFV